MLVLTLQFIRPLYRERLIQSIWRGLGDNGCLIVVEKVLGENSTFNRLFIKHYYEMKRRNGYSELEISQKREALENVLVPTLPGPGAGKTEEQRARSLLERAGLRDLILCWQNEKDVQEINQDYIKGVRFHFVARGQCWLRAEQTEPVLLEAGDLALLPHGVSHSIASSSDAPARPIETLGVEAVSATEFRLSLGPRGEVAHVDPEAG